MGAEPVNSIGNTVDHVACPAGRGIPYTLSAPQGGELINVPKERYSPSGLFQEGWDVINSIGDTVDWQERASPFPKILKL